MVGADRRAYAGMVPPLLFGRERELGVLRRHLDAALAGHGSLVLIGGEAGIGKTALAEALCREAEAQGALALVGRCYDLTETPPYGPWIELFGRYQSGDRRPALPTAFAERGTVGAVTSQNALFHDVQDFLATLSTQRPLVVLLDDLHWADQASLDLLRFLSRSVADSALLILATYRSDELTRHHPLYQLLPVLERESRATRMDLRRLTPEAVQSLMASRYALADAETTRLVAYLFERAEGNAFFTLQLLRALEEEDALRFSGDSWQIGDLDRVRLPMAVRQVIDGRLGRLDAESQRLLAIAAVIGQDVSFELWATIVGHDEATLIETVEQATAAHLVDATADGAGVRFVHALIREALYEGILPLRRRILHRKVGEALAALPNTDPDAVAYHFQQAGDARAVEWLTAAGKRAQRAYAWRTAIDRYEAALHGADRPEAEGLRGWLLYRLSVVGRYDDLPKAIAYADEAAWAAIALGDRPLAAAALLNRGWLRYIAGDWIDAGPLLTDGVAALEALSPAELARIQREDDPGSSTFTETGRSNLALFLTYVGRYAEARDMSERLLVAPRAPSDLWATTTVGDACFSLGKAYAMLGRPAAAREAFVRARTAYRAADQQVMLAWAPAEELEMLQLPYHADHVEERAHLAAEAEAVWRRMGDIGHDFPPRLPCAPLLLIEGAWHEAAELMRAGRGSTHSSARAIAARVAVQLAYAHGEWEEAWRQIRAALPAGCDTEPGTVSLLTALTMQRVAVALALDAGDVPAAREWLEAHERFIAWGGAVLGRAEGHLMRAAYERAAGDVMIAQKQATLALAAATEPRQPLAFLAAHRLLGELDIAAGRYDDAESHLVESLALADTCAAPYERALTLIALADLRSAAGDAGRTNGLIEEIRALCAPLGAAPALARAEQIATRLLASNGKAARPAGLTPREIEVLRRIASGASNQEIADALFLSLRTVNRHIANLYRKIDARGKADATAFAFRHHLA